MSRGSLRARNEWEGRSTIGRIWWVVCCFLLCSKSAFAHSIGLSRGEYRATADGLRAELVLARAEVVASVPSLDQDRNGVIAEREVGLARAELEAWIVPNIRVSGGAQPCAGKLAGAALTAQDGLVFRLVYHCPVTRPELAVSLDLLSQLSHGHRHLAHVVSDSYAGDEVCFKGQNAFRVPGSALGSGATPAGLARPPAWAMLGFLRMGFEHILSGYDHLLFLFALVLVARRARAVALVVTAFTVAHSLSLGLVVLGLFSPPAWLVEPAIALSIAYVGAENLLANSATIGERRWRVTFMFGLVHGLGFAGALRQVEIPRSQLPGALVLFNLGVELGQLAVLIVLLPLVFKWQQRRWFARGARASSLAVAVTGLVWFVARASAARLPDGLRRWPQGAQLTSARNALAPRLASKGRPIEALPQDVPE